MFDFLTEEEEEESVDGYVNMCALYIWVLFYF